MLKAELHAHVRGDPIDGWIRYSARDLIDRLSSQGYDVVAITPHTTLFSDPVAEAYARSRNMVLLRGIEARIDACDVLIYTTQREIEQVRSWDELAAFRKAYPDALVIAPHPFFPRGVGHLICERPDLFDAWEWSAFYSRSINLNRRLKALSRTHGKPIVGAGDIHSLAQIGRTFTLIDAERTPESVIEGVKRGAVSLETSPLRSVELIRMFAPLFPSYIRSHIARLLKPSKR